MSYGFTGKILHIDLTSGQIKVEEPEKTFYRLYPGGGACGAYYLLRDKAYDKDPFDPGNTLVFAPGVTTGAPVSGLSRCSVTARSPLTGAIGDSQAGGSFGPALKKCGFDALVIRGKAASPVYLRLEEGQAYLEDACHIWGKTIAESEEALRKSGSAEKPSPVAAIIGPAGENLVRYACIAAGSNHYFGRTGMGAVMGSKNLKAVVLRPWTEVNFADKAALQQIAKKGASAFHHCDGAQFLRECGTAGAVMMQNASGGLPTWNFQTGYFPQLGDAFEEALKNATGKQETCYGCVVKCKKALASSYEENYYAGLPEYESLAALGAYTGVDCLDTLIEANELCSLYGMDTISAGATVAFVMDCCRHGLLPSPDYPELDISFGDGHKMLELLKMIGERKGAGHLLAEGSARAAYAWGEEALKLTATVKGQETPAHLPHLKKSLALAYGLNPFGADHVSSEHDSIFASEDEKDREILAGLGLHQVRPASALDEEKANYFSITHRYYSLLDTLNLCSFCFGLGWIFDAADIVDIVRAATGWRTNFYELLLAGERRINMQRVFNIKAGFTNKDDQLPKKLFKPLEGGITQGENVDKSSYERAVRAYYQLAGWDLKTGYPTKEKLIQLSLEWLA